LGVYFPESQEAKAILAEYQTVAADHPRVLRGVLLHPTRRIVHDAVLPGGNPEQNEAHILDASTADDQVDVLEAKLAGLRLDNLPIDRDLRGVASRPDNALLIPETGGFGAFARYMFYALADYDSLGFAPFGIDRISAAVAPEGIPGVSIGTSLMDLVRPMMDNYRLLAPALDQIAAWQGTGKLRSAVEEDQITERLLNIPTLP
jgi:hypothetical protein